MKTLHAAPLLIVPLALVACSSAVTPDKLAQVKPGMKPEQVEALLGRSASIQQSETSDQTVSGEVDLYPASHGQGHVVIVNHVVFKSEFNPQ